MATTTPTIDLTPELDATAAIGVRMGLTRAAQIVLAETAKRQEDDRVYVALRLVFEAIMAEGEQ